MAGAATRKSFIRHRWATGISASRFALVFLRCTDLFTRRRFLKRDSSFCSWRPPFTSSWWLYSEGCRGLPGGCWSRLTACSSTRGSENSRKAVGSAAQFHWVVAKFFAQFHKRHLRTKPARVPSDTVHRLDSVVANQENPFAQHHIRFKSRPHPLMAEFKITSVAFCPEQSGAQRPGVGSKILLKVCFPGAGVGQQTPLFSRQRNDCPFVEHGFLVPRVHLLGTRVYQPGRLVN